MVIIHQNNLKESMLLEISVRICPSFWYQMALSRVLAHGLKGPAFCFAFEVGLYHHVTLTVHTPNVHSQTIWRTRTICLSLETILTLF